MALQEVYEQLNKIWYLEEDDKMALELQSAIHITRMQMLLERIFLMFVAPSSSGKSTKLRLLDDKGEETFVLGEVSSRSFVSGFIAKQDKEEKEISIVPQMNGKTTLIFDMAKTISKSASEKDMLWSTMIELYDGMIKGNYGNGKSVEHRDLKINLMACATPNIYSQMLLSQTLGTRFLFFNLERKDENKFMEQCLKNERNEEYTKILDDSKKAYQDFIKSLEYKKDLQIEEETLRKITKWAVTSSKLRASAKIDFSSGGLIEKIHIEEPARLYNQFLVIYKGLMSLGEDYQKERALRIIGKIALSNCNPNRIDVLKCLIVNNSLHEDGFSKRDVSQYLKISDKTCQGELFALWNLGLIDRTERIVDASRDERWYKFKVNKENEIVKHFAEYYDLSDLLEVNFETIRIQ